MSEPVTLRTARLSLLRGLLEEARYASQQDLAEALRDVGVKVSQSTLSKDLMALGAMRRRAEDGSLVYALGDDEDPHVAAHAKLARLCSEVLQSIQVAGNQVVLRTPPGAAQYFASIMDGARLAGAIGTIAGDDTVLVISSDIQGAERLAAKLSDMTRTGKPQLEENK